MIAARQAPSEPDAPLALVPLLACLLLYFGLPDAVTGPVEHWSTYPRFATYLLLSLLLLPRGRFEGREALWLVPGVIAALGMSGVAFSQFREFGARAEPFRELFSLVEPDRRLLPLSLENLDPAVKEPALEQFHGYLAAARRLYDPKIFDHPTNPLRFRAEGRLPHVAWRSGQPFSMSQHGRFYDYILVQGLARDPVPEQSEKSGIPVRLLKETGRWRLYSVERAR